MKNMLCQNIDFSIFMYIYVVFLPNIFYNLKEELQILNFICYDMHWNTFWPTPNTFALY